MRWSNRSSGPSNSPSRIFRSSVLSSETMCGTAPATFSGARSSPVSERKSSFKSVSSAVTQPRSFENLRQRHARNLLRLLTSLSEDRIELLITDLFDALLDRPQKLNRRLRKIAFQLRVSFARKVFFDFRRRLARDQVINLEQV